MTYVHLRVIQGALNDEGVSISKTCGKMTAVDISTLQTMHSQLRRSVNMLHRNIRLQSYIAIRFSQA